jgi:CTP:molybdopterin cytidylyltransferase MocA
MFSSLQEASRWTGWLSTLTHWIISLGDQPHIQTSTLCVLLERCEENPTRICQPALNGRDRAPDYSPGE